MTDIRRTILWVIFGFTLVLLWDQWQVYNGHTATFFPQAPKKVATAQAPTGPSSVPSASSSAPQAGAAISAVPATPAASAAAAASEKITVTTDVMRLTFDTEGGSLIRTELLQQRGDEGEDPRRAAQ